MCSNKISGKKYYNENPEFKKMLRKIRCICCMPAHKMIDQFDKLKKEAYSALNNGKRGKGVKGSPMHKFSKLWNTVRQTYLSGQSSICEVLSWYERPRALSNQPIEGT